MHKRCFASVKTFYPFARRPPRRAVTIEYAEHPLRKRTDITDDLDLWVASRQVAERCPISALTLPSLATLPVTRGSWCSRVKWLHQCSIYVGSVADLRVDHVLKATTMARDALANARPLEDVVIQELSERLGGYPNFVTTVPQVVTVAIVMGHIKGHFISHDEAQHVVKGVIQLLASNKKKNIKSSSLLHARSPNSLSLCTPSTSKVTSSKSAEQKPGRVTFVVESCSQWKRLQEVVFDLLSHNFRKPVSPYFRDVQPSTCACKKRVRRPKKRKRRQWQKSGIKPSDLYSVGGIRFLRGALDNVATHSKSLS